MPYPPGTMRVAAIEKQENCIVGIREDDDMGIMIGKVNSAITRIAIKNQDGSVAGHIVMTKPVKKKPKSLKYNFKEISVQIMNSKTSSNARKVASSAHNKVALLRQKLLNGDYDSKELESALAHALKMEKIAKKRMKHLQQEERIRQKGNNNADNTTQVDEVAVLAEDKDKKELSLKEEELEKLMLEYQKLMQEAMAQSAELLISDEFLDEIMEDDADEMCSGDLERLKKKHRAQEQKEITEADLKYLKSLFERLSREKQAAGSGIGSNADNTGSSGGSGNNYGSTGVSLELSGMKVPVQATEAAATAESGGVDITV